MKPREAPKGFWTILGLAVMVGFTAIAVGSTLEAPAGADDDRIFFVIGAGLMAVLLFLAAEAWRFLAMARGK
ncbi:MAG TPA: hypothetical protein VIZ17_15525 [Acetobacteraceae bacterium]|jgi:hypothetical protein